jgi:hypothetical protein
MKLVIWIIFAAFLAAISQAADAPAPDTVANCSTDWECENGPDNE